MEDGQDLEVEQMPDHILLNERFKREEVDFPHGRLEVRDVMPENPRDDVPLVSTLGFGTGNIALERTVSELYDSDEHVIELDFIGGGKGVKGEKGSSSEYNRQGMLLADFMDEYFKKNPHIEQMDIMSQSAALFRVFALAELRPDLVPKIRNLVLTAPFGLNEDDSLLGIARRQRAEDKRYKNAPRGEFDEDNDNNLNKAFKKTVLPYPTKAAKEIWAMAKADQYPKLEKLRKKGVKIGVIQGDGDELAPIHELMKRVGKGYKSPFMLEISPPTADMVTAYVPQDKEPPPIDVLRIVKGGHGVQVDDPKKAAKMILGTIDFLNNQE